ncbi:MAG: hypothetical protein OIN88_08920 [Candidatus Methanoperedens sp.]|nr:hypothetical protein [Candidatus Methanoperedens sp.]
MKEEIFDDFFLNLIELKKSVQTKLEQEKERLIKLEAEMETFKVEVNEAKGLTKTQQTTLRLIFDSTKKMYGEFRNLWEVTLMSFDSSLNTEIQTILNTKLIDEISKQIPETPELEKLKKMTEEEMKKYNKVTGGTVITAGRDVIIDNVSSQVAIGENITQIQKLSSSDKEELRESLIHFQKEIARLNLSAETMATVNGDLTAAIKEAKKEEPDASKIKSRFEGTIDTIKEVGDIGDTIEKVSKWEWTGKIIKILGKLGLSILL